MRRAQEAIFSLLEEASSFQPQSVVAVGTAPFRRAVNASVLCERIRQGTGLEVRVLTGEEEATLNREGVASSFTDSPDRPTLVVDIGGGSTELALSSPRGSVSLPAGAVTISEKHMRSDPPECREMAAAREDVTGRVVRAWQSLGTTAPSPRLVGVGGTVTSCASIELGLAEDDPRGVHGYLLKRDGVLEVTRLLASLPLAQRRRVKGLHPDRAPAILGGMIMLTAIMEQWECETAIASEADLLYAVTLNVASGRWSGDGSKGD